MSARLIASTLPARRPAQLATTVAGMLTTRWRRPVRVEHLACAPSPMAVRVPTEVLTATLDGGHTCQIFLKSLGDEDTDHPDKQCRDRELRVYRHLMADRRLPVPGWIGGEWNPHIGRHDLYLEYVAAWDLRYHGLETWNLAASRLGGLQRSFALRRHQLRRHDFLLRQDAAYYQGWAHRAMDSLRAQSTTLARRYEPVMSAARDWGGLLATQPSTLVHNDLSAKNVLVDRRTARVCIVDWDMAGVGCGLLDLVQLSFGLRPAEAARLRAHYYRAVRGSDLLPRRRQELISVLAACAIHETNVRLWCARKWSLPDGRLAGWVDDTRAALERIV